LMEVLEENLGTAVLHIGTPLRAITRWYEKQITLMSDQFFFIGMCLITVHYLANLLSNAQKCA
jgi:hypothetical protein